MKKSYYTYADIFSIIFLFIRKQKELAENESKLEQYKRKMEDKKKEYAEAELEKQNVEIEMRKHTDKLEVTQRNIREKEVN